MDTTTTKRLVRQRERLAGRQPTDGPAVAGSRTPTPYISSEELVPEHLKGANLRTRDRERFTTILQVPRDALDFEANRHFNPLLRDRIAVRVPYFEFARDAQGEDRTVWAFTLVVYDIAGDPVDIVAYRPYPNLLLTLLGRASMVGEHHVLHPRLRRGLRVHRTLGRYLAHGRRGIVLLNPTRAARVLDGVHLIPEDHEHRRELQTSLVAGPVILEPGED